MKRAVITILIVIIFSFSSCGSSPSVGGSSVVYPTISSRSTTVTTAVDVVSDVPPKDSWSLDKEATTWSEKSARTVHLSDEDVRQLLYSVQSMDVEYDQAPLHDLNQCERRLNAIARNASHPTVRLDLSLSGLETVVTANNKRYMESSPMLVEVPDTARLHEACEVITRYVPMALEWLEEQGVEIDRERVCCTLSDLKIIEKPGMLNFATVTKERILYISENSADIVTNLYGENAYRDTLVHEAMHLIQLGCPCEAENDWDRRAGIAYSYPDFEENSLDWAWFPEGIAEHTMSLLTGDEPITYASYLRYLRTFHLVTVPDTTGKAHAVDAIGYEGDPRALFSLLSDDVLPETEMLSMMTSLSVLLDEPDAFIHKYQAISGTDLTSNREAHETVMYSMEADVCATLAKCFYVHLGQLLSSGADVTAEDLAFLLNLFESTSERHLRFTKEEYYLYNLSFTETYTALREILFRSLQTSDGTDFAEFYASYRPVCEPGVLNASLSWLDAEGRDVLLEAVEALEYTTFPKVP